MGKYRLFAALRTCFMYFTALDEQKNKRYKR